MSLPSALLISFFVAASRLAAEEAAEVVAPPGWVVPQMMPKTTSHEDIDPSTAARSLLVDRQINAQNHQYYHHYAVQVLTPEGVQKHSHITVDYDPAYQTLAFHWVRVWRRGKAVNRLDTTKIQTSAHGLDTDTFLFSSEKTATLLLDDIRSGDIIEYAYTVTGDNPALSGKFAGGFGLQGEEPIELLYNRLLWPRPRLLYIKNHNSDVRPAAIAQSNLTEFIWVVHHAPGLHLEPATPPYYDPFAWVQLSEFRQWSDVNKWALPLFNTTNAPDADLLKQIRQWKALPSDEARVLAALRFVQDDIRYLGVESGAAGYEPANASAVFARRYGDCKDKTLLLVTISRALRIQAYPVLVNTVRRQNVAELHPSPILFDHAISAVFLNGQTYWLDATAMFERGPLEVRSWPPYGVGLLVKPGTTALTEIPFCPIGPKTLVTQQFQIGNLNAESSLRIVTDAEGPDAEDWRATFSTTPREDLERSFLNDEAKLYPDIRVTAPPSFVDDESRNHVQIVETYAIKNIWTHPPDDTVYRCYFYSDIVARPLRKPSVSFRTMPLAIPFPLERVSRIEADIPAPIPFTPSAQTIEDPAFTFRRTASANGAQLVILHEYHSLTNAVAPEQLPDYVHHLDSATELLGYGIRTY